MTDRDPFDDLPADISGLPMQPTGSGVADLEVAFERMKLAAAGGSDAAEADVSLPTGDAAAESEAHPS